MKPAFAYLHHPACGLHEMDRRHPESPLRYAAVDKALRDSTLLAAANQMIAPLASHEALCRVHDDSYVTDIVAQSPETGYVTLDPDTSLNPHSIEAAKAAAGSAVAAVDWVMQAPGRRSFSNVRPPGHHAVRERAMGFCIFNSVGVGIAHALATYPIDRIALVDFDVHHGNGSEEMFAGDPRVKFYSTFQHPYYPHSGVPSAAANIVNVPLSWGAGSLAVRRAFNEIILPDLLAFKPQLLFISAGFDAHERDQMAGLNFTTEDYAWMTAELVKVANLTAEGRVVSMLEGGYDIESLCESVLVHVAALQA
jgi:acetoin utilization deacetylase AcuC-like enzyme